MRSFGIRAVREQEMPKWNKLGQEKAVLDIVYHDLHAGQVCVDVCLSLTPSFLGPLGVQAWLWSGGRRPSTRLDKAERVEVIRACRKFVAHALQTCVAEQLLVAASPQTMEGPRRARPQQPPTVGGVSAELTYLR